jgi:hypothetical protein
MRTVEDAVHALARTQRLVVTRDQVLALGGTDEWIRARTDSGRWNGFEAGVYLTSPGTPDWFQRCLGACLALQGKTALSHRAAAALYALDGTYQSLVEVSTDYVHNPRLDAAIVHRTQRWHPDDLRTLHGIPVTSINRTLLDYASVVPRLPLERAVESAILRGLTSEGGLRRAMGRLCGRGCRGCAQLRWVLDHRPEGKPARSGFEVMLLDLIREYQLPIPHRNYTVHEDGRAIAEVDLAYVARLLALEADGRRWHSTRRAHERDVARQEMLEKLGWIVIRFTWDEVVHHPARVGARIRAALDGAVAA